MRLPEITIWKEKEFTWPPYIHKGEHVDYEITSFDWWTCNFLFWQLELIWWVDEANT